MISIVVPVRRHESARRLGASIKHRTEHEYQLILVDGDGGMNEKINEGLRAATGDWVVLLHDDVEVIKGWDKVLPKYAGALHTHELGGQIWIWGGNFAGGYHVNPDSPVDYPSFPVLSRKVVQRLGEMDEAYREPGHQDVDLGMRLRDIGIYVECLPGKIFHHHLRTKPLSEENKRYFEDKWQTR